MFYPNLIDSIVKHCTRYSETMPPVETPTRWEQEGALTHGVPLEILTASIAFVRVCILSEMRRENYGGDHEAWLYLKELETLERRVVGGE